MWLNINNIDEIDTLPFRNTGRIDGLINSMKWSFDSRIYSNRIYKKVKNIIKGSVGEKYDDIFSKLCKIVPDKFRYILNDVIKEVIIINDQYFYKSYRRLIPCRKGVYLYNGIIIRIDNNVAKKNRVNIKLQNQKSKRLKRIRKAQINNSDYFYIRDVWKHYGNIIIQFYEINMTRITIKEQGEIVFVGKLNEFHDYCNIHNLNYFIEYDKEGYTNVNPKRYMLK